MKNSKRRIWLLILVVIAIGVAWVVWSNTALELNEYEIRSEELPESFDGFRIAQVSDLHNAKMGEGNSKLLDMLEEAEADIIVMTGDMVDSRNTDLEIVLQFAKQAVEIAPCYYVTGNHESRLTKEVYHGFSTFTIL